MPKPSCVLPAVALVALSSFLASCGGGSSGADTSVQSAGATDELTYYQHVKSLIDTRCVTCHREGGQAPFSLTEFPEVQSKRSAISFALQSETMPPPGFSSLTDTERSLLLQWSEKGGQMGNPDTASEATPYTYYGQTKAIIEARCSNCHSPGEIAPFSLNDYDSVYAVRAAIAHQVESGAMPPWPPTNHYLPFKNNRSLSADEKAILTSWIAGGAPQGNAEDYVAQPRKGAPIEYNVTVSINEPYTPVTRPDEYRCLMIDWPLEKTVFVNAVNVIPDAKQEVHHVFAVVVPPENLAAFEAKDGADGRPGFPCWGAPSPEDALVPPRTLTVWAPGITAGALPEGTGIRIDPGSKLAMQMHYNTINTDPVPDQSSLEIRYVDSVEREAITLFFLNVGWYFEGGMPIPAGDPNVTHQYTGDPTQVIGFSGGSRIGIDGTTPFAMHSAFMHQHVLGKSTSVELIREDGTETMLTDIRDWDFDWQDEYFFEEEVIVYPNDKLRLTCTWDNSASNQQFVHAEQLASQYVEFGEGTVDEMCVNYFYVTKVAEKDVGKIQTFEPTVAFHRPQNTQVFSPGDVVPIELLTNSFKLQEPQESHAEHGHTDVVDDNAGGHYHHSGHYHLYLDSEDDADEHLTQWDPSTYYKLPEDIAPGAHTFRVSLRNDLHEAMGVESRVTFEVKARAQQDDSVQSLIAVDDWRLQGAGEDSLASHRPQNTDCSSNAWYEEDGATEVETGYCNYLSLAQTTKAPINIGDNIHLVLWHGQLRFDEPAEAHVAVSVAGVVVWEDSIEIPNAGGVYDITVPAAIEAPAGEKIEYHLHNHGYNTWTLLTLDVER